MSINTTNITSGPYAGNDVADQFAYTFRVDDKSQVIVYETDGTGAITELTVDTDFTVTGLGIDGGGTITRVAGALPTGYTWYIRANYKPTQLTSFPSQGGFFPEVHETAFDKLTFLVQQILDSVTRSLRYDESESSSAIVEIAPIATRANKALGFTSSGDLTYLSGTMPVGTLREYLTLAAMVADVANISIGDVIILAERFTGNGGGAWWNAVDATTVTENEYNVVTGNATISFVLIVDDVINTKQWGVVGDGATNDTSALQSAITSASGKELHVEGSVLITSGLTGVSNCVIKGVGRDATIKTATADINLWTFTGNSDVTVDGIKFEMVVGTNQTYNHCLIFSACDNIKVIDCEFSGMSGDGVRGTGGTTHLTVENNYFHSFTGSLQNSTDIDFYNDCTFSIAINNKCYGGNWHGIKLQIDSRDNSVLNNKVGMHTAYGIVAYETTPSETRNIIANNKIEGITGDALIGGFKIAGAGIYILGQGNTNVTDNVIKNCNINTAAETLSPGAIGISASTHPIVISGNIITDTKWYGIAVFSNTLTAINIYGNTINECTKTAIYMKNGNYTNINNNTIRQVTNSARAIHCTDLTTTRDQANVTGNLITGSSAAIEINNINNSVISDNVITNCSDRGVMVQNIDRCTINNNVVNESGNNCLRLSAAKYVHTINNVLKAAAAVTNYIDTAGVCTGSIIDDRVVEPTASITAFADGGGGQVVVTSASHGMSNGETINISGTTNYNGNFITSNVTTNTFEITATWVADDAAGIWKIRKILSNAATGCQLITRGNGAPSGTFQNGDRVYNTEPSAGARSMGWVYDGAWKTWGDITA